MRVGTSLLMGSVALGATAKFASATTANPNGFATALCDGSLHSFRLVGSDMGAFVIETTSGLPVKRVRDTEHGCVDYVFLELDGDHFEETGEKVGLL